MASEDDNEVMAINEKLEALVEEMSNTKSATLIGALNNYPVISVSAHVRPFHIYWLNLVAGVIFPIGLFFYFRIWAFRVRLAKDMERIYAQEKGVLRRAGHTEATIDMARLAGLYPAGALMEIMSEDGTMARLPELRQMADEHGLKLISIHDLIVYRLKQESIVEKGVEVNMPTEHGMFRLIPFRQKSNGLEHMAIFKGTWSEDEPILVRVHSSCATGDILGSQRCDCGEQLHKAMEMIEKEGKGVVVYLNQEGRGIGLMEKMKAYKLQEDGMDTVDANICLGHLADERDYGVGAQILRELGVHKMRLLTNNPVKRVGLEAYGLEIVENVPVETVPNPYNERYLRTKKERMGHTLHFNK